MDETPEEKEKRLRTEARTTMRNFLGLFYDCPLNADHQLLCISAFSADCFSSSYVCAFVFYAKCDLDFSCFICWFVGNQGRLCPLMACVTPRTSSVIQRKFPLFLFSFSFAFFPFDVLLKPTTDSFVFLYH